MKLRKKIRLNEIADKTQEFENGNHNSNKILNNISKHSSSKTDGTSSISLMNRKNFVEKKAGSIINF